MKKFKDFSIARKILTGFLALTFIAVLIGGVGIVGMLQINKMDTYLYENQMAPIDHLISALKSLYNMRVDLREAVIASGDIVKISSLEESINENAQNFLIESAAYRESIQGSNSIVLFDEAEQLFKNSFMPATESTIKMAKVGDQKGANGAVASATKDIETLFGNYDKLVNARMQSALETSKSNDSTSIVTVSILGVVIAIGAGIAVFLGLKIARIISTPISHIVNAANQIAVGHIDVDLKNINSKDETGQLAESFEKMLDGIRKQVKVAETISNGDFTAEIELRSDKDVLGLALQKIEHDLNETMQLISSSADQVNSGASQISDGAQALSSGTTEQASTIQELNASIANIADQAEQNASSVRTASGYVNQVASSINSSSEHMGKLNGAMQQISTASSKISTITKAIEDIAFQTNILALNAAIEAARAGVAGKGFAVVADEVRVLAAKSAEAAKETANLIKYSVDTVVEGEHLAEETSKFLADVEEKARLVEQAISQIELASTEQAATIEQINQGLVQVSAVIQNNAATAEESSASSEELSAQAQTLQEEVSKFKLQNESKMLLGKRNILTVASVKSV